LYLRHLIFAFLAFINFLTFINSFPFGSLQKYQFFQIIYTVFKILQFYFALFKSYWNFNLDELIIGILIFSNLTFHLNLF